MKMRIIFQIWTILSVFWLFLSTEANTQTINISRLGNQKNEIKFYAFGGSLSSSVTIDGIHDKSKQLSFPDIIATQMGIKNFKGPDFKVILLDDSDKIFENNSIFSNAIKIAEVNVSNSDISKVNNLSLPFQMVRDLAASENEPGAFLPNFSKKSYFFLNAFDGKNESDSLSYLNFIKKTIKEIDFFTWELGYDDFASYFLNGAYQQSISFVNLEREGVYPEEEIIQYFLSKGAKGVIANVPNILNFPIFRYYSTESLVDNSALPFYVQKYGKNEVAFLSPKDILLPTPQIVDFIEGRSDYGRSQQNPLRDEEVICAEEYANPDYYNFIIERIAKKNGLPIVDINSLFNKILTNEFVTHDGVKIDPSYPNGNFFLADGITLSPIGQAIVANEFIQTINLNFSTNIPLVQISKIDY